MMKQLFSVFAICFLLIACDDGDITEVELEFDNTLELCELDEDLYVLYDIKSEAPYESLILSFPTNGNEDIFNPDEIMEEPQTMQINGSTIRFIYRTYNNDPDGLLCEVIPDADLTILNSDEATTGTIQYQTTFVDDDNDGIPSILEDINGNGDLTDDDTDGDGIPNYLDADDDGDNVLTEDENPDPNDDGDLSDALDTDSDGIPNYLDEDDDGDGILTRYEDEDMNLNPGNDFDIDSSIPRYLDFEATDEYIVDSYRDNTYTRTYTTVFYILNFNIGILSQDILYFGSYENSETFTQEFE